MPTRPDERLAAALLQLLAAPRGATAAGVFSIDRGACRLLTGNPALLALMPAPHDAALPVPPGLSGGCRRLDPGALGLDARFAAVVPIETAGATAAGFLVLADRAPRRLTPALAARLTDAAALAAPLLARAAAAAAARPPAARAPLDARDPPADHRPAPGGDRDARAAPPGRSA